LNSWAQLLKSSALDGEILRSTLSIRSP
jgi:hypothetical protein